MTSNHSGEASVRDTLVSLIPEFSLIQDEGLREATLRALVGAMARGGWTTEDLQKMPFTLILDPSPATMLEHIRGVTRTALALADALEKNYGGRFPMKVDRDVLVSAAILHDVGKFLEYERDPRGRVIKSPRGGLLRHPFSGVAMAFAEDAIPEEVFHAIAYHSHEGTGARTTTEAILIYHADFANFEPFRDVPAAK